MTPPRNRTVLRTRTFPESPSLFARRLRLAAPGSEWRWAGRPCGLAAAAALLLAAIAGAAAPQAGLMPSASGLLEVGVPAFAVYGLDSLGLSTAPTDLEVLPDGRFVLVAGNRIAFGDGSKWEVILPEAESAERVLQNLAVADDGRLYHGTYGGFGQIDLGPDGRWRQTSVARIPSSYGEAQLPMIQRFRLEDRWLWGASGGRLFSWSPGEEPRPFSELTEVRSVFTLGSRLFLVNQLANVFELRDGLPQAAPGFEALPSSYTVTAVVAWSPGEVLIGSESSGAVVYDGRSARPFVLTGGSVLLRQVNDLCALGDGLYAAAAGTSGIVCFDQSGRVLQVLDRSLDHRLAAVRQLRYFNNTLWALLADGIARIEFPSPLTEFGPLSPTLLIHSRPLRHEGKLWVLTDGVVLRAEYTSEGRLVDFAEDTPRGEFVWTLASVDGALLACTNRGIRQRTPDGWQMRAEGARNARIEARAPDGRWIYVARMEQGFVDIVQGRAEFERQPGSDQGEIFGVVQGADGVVWCELGAGRVGRIAVRPGQPGMQVLSASSGLPDSWVQIWELDGEVFFGVAGRVLSYDGQAGRFVEAAARFEKLPELRQGIGRPVRDARGRLWVTARGTVNVMDGQDAAAPSIAGLLPVGLQPTAFVPEENGVMWILAPQRLIRYDPSVPAREPGPVQPLITRVKFPETGRVMHGPFPELSLPYAENSLEIAFTAPRNPFRQNVTFELLLGGLGDRWLPGAGVPFATYNNLAEGRYEFRVRAVVNGVPGAETRLDFAIAPPWFRTPLAYIGYSAGALLVLFGGAGVVYLVNRREQVRLAALVAERTQELQASEDQLRRAVDAGSVGLWEWDVATGRLTWNTQIKRIFGLPPEMEGITLAKFVGMIHPEDRSKTEDAFRGALASRLTFRHEYRIVRPDGEARWVAAIGQGVFDAAGQPIAMRGAVLDVTERRQAENELRQREELQRQMIASSPIAMLMMDRDQRVLYGNATFTRLFGYEIAEIPDVEAWWPRAYPDPVYREQVRSAWNRRLEAAARTHQPVEPMEATVTCKDGTQRIVHASTSEVGERTLVVFSDVTARKRAEQAILDINTTLERRVKERTAELEATLKELESFSYSVSHDLRAPLRGIDGWSLALIEEYSDRLDETARGYLRRVRAEGQRLGNLIDDLLNLSRTSRAEFRPAPVDLSELARATARRVEDNRPAPAVEFACVPGLRCRGDTRLLELALFNLLDNAWKFSSKAAQPRVEFGQTETDRGPAFFVRDNGAGFDMRHARKLFGVFQRMHTQEEFPGTGVGLATVQRIIHRHGGRIWAESTPGVQTTFFFQLPEIGSDHLLPVEGRLL
jgi:PAS domain S-box-containing protein